MTAAQRILLICHDPVGARMRGLGIRYHELASVLAAHADVTLAHGGEEQGRRPDAVRLAPFRPHAPDALRPLIEQADMIVTHPQWPVVNAWLRRSGARVVFDLYDPETLETLELFAGARPALRRLMTDTTLDRLHDALRTGHHFVCASEKQRDLWLGAMLALRLIEPDAYARDPSFRSVLDLVPFGVPADPPSPAHGGGPIRARFPGIGPEDQVILWNGGVWSWLDASTAVRAGVALAERRSGARLVFMGGSDHPAAREAELAARELARELGALDRTVFFNDAWVPYAERAVWLTGATCALSLHLDHLETRFAFRTRLLDCFWAGLPVVCTTGDALAERVSRDGLGATVPPGDPAAVVAALEGVLTAGRAAYAEALGRAAAAHAWPRVAAPLVELSRLGRPAEPPLGRRASVLRPAAGHRLRALAYRAGGRQALARRGN